MSRVLSTVSDLSAACYASASEMLPVITIPAMAIAPTVSYQNSIAAIAGNDPAHSHGRQHGFSSFAPRASIAAYSVLLFLSVGLLSARSDGESHTAQAIIRSEFGTCSARSEIRLVGVRHRLHVIVEKAGIVFSADFLAQRTLLDAPVTLERGPRRREGAGVLDIGNRFQRFSALDDAVALDDMQLVGVRRAITIDEGPDGEPDRVHHQSIAVFIVAYGIAKP